jgi:hypothetical protein
MGHAPYRRVLGEQCLDTVHIVHVRCKQSLADVSRKDRSARIVHGQVCTFEEDVSCEGVSVWYANPRNRPRDDIPGLAPRRRG